MIKTSFTGQKLNIYIMVDEYRQIIGFEDYFISKEGDMKRIKIKEDITNYKKIVNVSERADGVVILYKDDKQYHYRTNYIVGLVFIDYYFLNKFLRFVERVLKAKENAGFSEYNDIITYWNHFYNELDDIYDSFKSMEQIYLMWSDLKYTYYFYKKYGYIELYNNTLVNNIDVISKNETYTVAQLRNIMKYAKYKKIKFELLDKMLKKKLKDIQENVE